MITGLIGNIQKYSIHDGPGIRTTVFFKGCPLACAWCHNPESIGPGREMLFWQNKCIRCGECVADCPEQALRLTADGIARDDGRCTRCGSCAEVCPTGAMESVGRRMTAAEVLKEVEKDRVFYEESGGGATFSGGECLTQPDFLAELLTACRAKGIHTVVDTSGYAPWLSLAKIADKADLFLYDVKMMDDEKHRTYTGVGNRLILENLQRLAGDGRKIWARVPVLPGINDDRDNIEETGRFLAGTGVRDVCLLPYHSIAAHKYERLGRIYTLGDLRPPSRESLAEMAGTLRKLGLHVQIGG